MTRILILPGLNGTADLMSGFLDQLPADHTATVVQYPTDMTAYLDLLAWISL